MDELKKRLLRYENSNVPPSKNSLLYRKMRRERMDKEKGGGGGSSDSRGSANGSLMTMPPTTKKPGRKNGHVGVTQLFKPTGRPIIHTMENCPKCDSTELSVTSTERRTVVDIPKPLPYTTREHVVNIYKCLGCGADDLIPESAKRELPSVVVAAATTQQHNNSIVTLGRNTLSVISLFWSVARLPLRKISYSIESLYRLKLSAATIGHALEKVSDRLEPFNEKVRKGINRSKRANFDETTTPVAGRKGWVWIGATKKYAFVRVEMSRGSDVLKKYFSKFKGVAIVDGLNSYKQYFQLIQRCWAHILNEALVLYLRSEGKGKKESQKILFLLRKLFSETKSELKKHPPPNRKLHDTQLRKLRYLLSKRYRDPDVVAFVSKLKRASNDLFTFTLYRGVDPTNNRAERELKEPIIHRKIRGQLKTEKGILMFGRLMTAVLTWGLQKLNPLEEFRKLL